MRNLNSLARLGAFIPGTLLQLVSWESEQERIVESTGHAQAILLVQLALGGQLQPSPFSWSFSQTPRPLNMARGLVDTNRDVSGRILEWFPEEVPKEWATWMTLKRTPSGS